MSALGISSLVFDQVNESIGKNLRPGPLNAAMRLLNAGVVQIWLGLPLFATIPHEFFGHHMRAGEFGISSKVYLNFPALGGKTVFYAYQSTPAIDRQMIVAAGPEVTQTIAYKATRELYSQPYSPSYIGDYFLAGKFVDAYYYYVNNVVGFISNPNKYVKDNASFLQANPVPNDPVAYLLALTESYGYYPFMDKNAIWLEQFPDMTVYTNNAFIQDQSRRMRRAYLLTALDPTNLHFLYGNGLYLITGKTFFKPFMIHAGNLSFMPSVRANLGELGIENYFDLYFKGERFPSFSVYYRQGGNLFDQLRGAGGEIQPFDLGNRFQLSGQLDYWNNSRLHTNNFNITTTAGFSDGKGFLTYLLTGGYKSKGNLMGKPFDKGPYVYLGLDLTMWRKIP